VAGVAAVLVLTAFVIVAGTRNGYSHVDDTISQLGARGTSGRWWFLAVNLVGAALIIVFAHGAHRRLPVGLATGAFLGAVALGAVLIGAVPCSGECRPDAGDAHSVVASYTAVMIASFLVAAAWAVCRSKRSWFTTVTLACMVANVALLVALLAAVLTDAGAVGLLERLFWASAYAWVLAASWAIIAATRRRPVCSKFDPALVQRKILRSNPTWTHAAYGLCSITDAAAAKRWLGAVIDPADGVVLPDDGTQPGGSVTLAFTCAGLRILGVDYRRKDPFAEGMKGRAAQLGDVGVSDPQRWQKNWRRDLHMLVWVEADSKPAVDALLETISDLDDRRALSWVGIEYATTILGRDGKLVDHRGFRDGISQPWVLLKGRDCLDPPRSAGGSRDAFGAWRPLAVGEFVLGEQDESHDVSPIPEPEAIFEHGSFLVVRKLAQDLAGLDSFVATQAVQLHLDPDEFEARLVGRRRDGRRLDAPAGTSEADLNNFTFGTDPDGLACPIGSHIRRANPRDALGFGMQLSERHRIIRRGKTYRDDAGAPAGWENGIMFVAVNARIDDQFEFIQRLWMNDGDRLRLGASRDAVAGSSRSPSTVVLQDSGRPVVTAANPVLIRTMGGEYFFAPSIAGLRTLAEWQDQPLGG
jgi:Dyp-type peroxidase family